MMFKSATEVASAVVRAYYEEHNVEKTLSCATENVEWVGTENRDSAKGKEELRALLQADAGACPGAGAVKMEKPSVQQLTADVAMVTLKGEQADAFGREAGPVVLATACCVKTEEGWLIASFHASVPNAEREKACLRNELNEEREKQKALLDNVPGGVAMYRLKRDGRIATDYVSDGLAKICGYDDCEAIMKVMEHDARKLVLPEDVPTVEAACKVSLEEGVPTSIHYRIQGPNGKPTMITLDSVVMKNAVLGEEDLAVFYAVQTVMSEAANQKAEEQATLISLLNTVPAGIGIFEVNADGFSQVYMNDAFYHLIGTKRDDRTQYFGNNTLESTHPDDVAILNRAIGQLLAGEDSVQLDYRVKGGGEKWYWLHLSAAVVERNTKCVRLHAAFNECTKSKQQQLLLLQNQKAVALAEKQGKLSIWTYNIDKGIISQPVMADAKGHLGYPAHIENVPQCFVENNSVHPDDIEKYLAAYHGLANGEEKVDVTYRLMNQYAGKYNWVHMFLQRMEDNEEENRMAVGFSLQVDLQQAAVERYQIEQKLREQMYAKATIYLEYNLTKRQYEGTNNFENRYPPVRWECWTEEDYRAKMSAVVDERYLDEVVEKLYVEHLLKLFETGESKVTCEYRSKDRPGKPSTWYRITYTMVKRPDTGDVMAFVCVEDIEQEKDRQLAIESSTSDGIEIISVIHAADGKARVVRSNYTQTPGGLGEYFTYDEDFVRRSHMGAVGDDREFGYHAALLSTVRKELETKTLYQYSISTKLGDGPTKRQLFRFRYLDDRKMHIILSVCDITSVYREAEEKKKKLEDALREAQKASQAKADFYSRMSHDMRTPMNGVLGMVALSEDETDSKKLKQNLSKIKESGEYLLSLINDTLDLQRIESGKMTLEPSIVSTSDVVGNIIDMVGITAKAKGVELKVSQGRADLSGYIRVDALRLKQIFVNLLSNAVKFTPAGGTVELEFELLAREGMVSHNVVYVRDTGLGMSREFLESGIFKPFSQERNAVSANYAGSGLGLSIAKRLVEMMGGHIEVESELGVGTTFAVHLDFERVEEAQAKAAMQREKNRSNSISSQLSGKKILLAEDHPLNAEIAKKLLKKVGCEVTWVKNGQVAVSCFTNAPLHAFDAVLMDIRMPIMDGLEATRQIRAQDKADAATVPIIAMTANAYAEDVKASLAAGMNAHLGKPIVPKDLYDTLAKYLAPG